MEVRKLRAGQVVRSVAGRDEGQFYIVLATVGDNTVLLTDGLRRKVDRPKRKNVKHIKIVSHADEEIKAKLAEGLKVTDADVRKILRGFVEKEGCW
ncbi:KOW domain-containing RNA-binding protein [Desulforudis sp. 1088]|uniref:KOW domain-containing RNA-binding protein n=1 Tax=unclassified Candidatus Desulforudis TaxID=2635950 RepID=UPI003493DF1F